MEIVVFGWIQKILVICLGMRLNLWHPLTVYDRTPADDAIICKRTNADIVITNKTPISAYVILLVLPLNSSAFWQPDTMLLILMQLRKQVFRYPTFLPMVQWLLVSLLLPCCLKFATILVRTTMQSIRDVGERILIGAFGTRRLSSLRKRQSALLVLGALVRLQDASPRLLA